MDLCDKFFIFSRNLSTLYYLLIKILKSCTLPNKYFIKYFKKEDEIIII